MCRWVHVLSRSNQQSAACLAGQPGHSRVNASLQQRLQGRSAWRCSQPSLWWTSGSYAVYVKRQDGTQGFAAAAAEAEAAPAAAGPEAAETLIEPLKLLFEPLLPPVYCTQATRLSLCMPSVLTCSWAAGCQCPRPSSCQSKLPRRSAAASRAS